MNHSENPGFSRKWIPSGTKKRQMILSSPNSFKTWDRAHDKGDFDHSVKKTGRSRFFKRLIYEVFGLPEYCA